MTNGHCTFLPTSYHQPNTEQPTEKSQRLEKKTENLTT